MLKRLLILLFALFICIQAVIQALIMIDWKVNQDFIAARYCVNKNKPELKCNGQCQLAKKLRKVENEINLLDSKGKNQSKKVPKLKLNEFIGMNNQNLLSFQGTTTIIRDFFDLRKSNYSCKFIIKIEHPPCVNS